MGRPPILSPARLRQARLWAGQGHAAEAFVVAQAAPGAWSPGTAVKYRQTLTALGGQLAGIAPAAAADHHEPGWRPPPQCGPAVAVRTCS